MEALDEQRSTSDPCGSLENTCETSLDGTIDNKDIRRWAQSLALSQYWAVMKQMPLDIDGQSSLHCALERRFKLADEVSRLRVQNAFLASSIDDHTKSSERLRQNNTQRRKLLMSIHSKVMKNITLLKHKWKLMNSDRLNVTKSQQDLAMILDKQKKCLDLAQNVARQLKITQSKRSRLLGSIPEKFAQVHQDVESQFSTLHLQTQDKVNALVSKTITLNDNQVANWLVNSLGKVEENKRMLEAELRMIESDNNACDEVVRKLTEEQVKLETEINEIHEQIRELDSMSLGMENDNTMTFDTEDDLLRSKYKLAGLERELAEQSALLHTIQCPVEDIPTHPELGALEKHLALVKQRRDFLAAKQVAITSAPVVDDLDESSLTQVLAVCKDALVIKAVAVMAKMSNIGQGLLANNKALYRQYHEWFSPAQPAKKNLFVVYDRRININRTADVMISCETETFVNHISYLELNLIRSVESWELTSIEQGPNVCKFNERFKNMSVFVVASILQQNRANRGAILERWIDIGAAAIARKSFQLAFEVGTSLTTSSIKGLSLTWASISSQAKAKFEQIESFINPLDRFANYERILSESDVGLTVPYLGAVLVALKQEIPDGKWNLRKSKDVAQQIDKVKRDWGSQVIFRINRELEERLSRMMNEPMMLDQELAALAEERLREETPQTSSNSSKE